MLSYAKIAIALFLFTAQAPALPILRREVPQEHSHEAVLTAVRASLNLNNPDKIQDPVFSLLGNAAAITGAGNIADATCLQQAVADQAFTNAKAAQDIEGMTQALIFRALERNSGKVGLATDPCTSIKAVNPEIAAISQHQDPASAGAAEINKAITLELAKQIASIGGDPQAARNSGTFAPGDVNDATGKGNTCDDANDPIGCIISQNLIVFDATPEEIDAAVAGVSSGTGNAGNNAADATAVAGNNDATATCAPPRTVTVTAGGVATATAVATSTSAAAAAATTTAAASTGTAGNLQTFTGALGGATAPSVTAGGRGFVVEGSDDFLNTGAALGRSCDIQHNKCANVANGGGADFTVGDCDQQNNECRAAI